MHIRAKYKSAMDSKKLRQFQLQLKTQVRFSLFFSEIAARFDLRNYNYEFYVFKDNCTGFFSSARGFEKPLTTFLSLKHTS